MAKTFNPNRIGGGTFSLVQDAQGNYSIKETGFDPVKSLNMVDLGAIAATTTAKKTETAADKTGTTTTDQTKQAFLLPKKDDKDDADRQANLFTRATDLSSGLQNTFDRPNMRDVAGEVTRIKDPTESVFGKSMPEEEQFRRQKSLPKDFQPETLGLKAPEVKLETQTAKQRTGKARIRGPRDLKTQTGVAFGRPEEGTIDQAAADAQMGRSVPDAIIEGQKALGVSSAPDAIKEGQPAIAPGVPDAIMEGQPAVAARKTFSESVKTALKGFKTPAMAVLESVSDALTSPQQRSLNNSNAAALGSLGYKTRGELGSSTDPGRIAGNPADNVFAGMNLKSARGNVMTASKARIDKIRASAAKTTDKAKAARMKAKADKFEKQRQEALDRKEKQQAAKNKADLAKGPGALGPAGGAGNQDKGGSRKIVCTMMNESYGFGSFRNKIWLRQSKNLAPEYQIGYHKLFLPLVKYAKQKGITNSIVKKTLEHIAIHRTIDIRQEEKNKIHLIGRVYRKILEPICYWAGKV